MKLRGTGKYRGVYFAGGEGDNDFLIICEKTKYVTQNLPFPKFLHKILKKCLRYVQKVIFKKEF